MFSDIAAFFADRTNGGAYASVVSVCRLSALYVHVLRLNGASYRRSNCLY